MAFLYSESIAKTDLINYHKFSVDSITFSCPKKVLENPSVSMLRHALHPKHHCVITHLLTPPPGEAIWRAYSITKPRSAYSCMAQAPEKSSREKTRWSYLHTRDRGPRIAFRLEELSHGTNLGPCKPMTGERL